ncbi:MAG: hypothetical protein HWE16_18905 [Gammaproteobacteria bacterium]|nr:hypothetical protein [Gammaproteobacteria bacterium]
MKNNLMKMGIVGLLASLPLGVNAQTVDTTFIAESSQPWYQLHDTTNSQRWYMWNTGSDSFNIQNSPNGGSTTQPFRIETGALTSAFQILANGTITMDYGFGSDVLLGSNKIGIGTATPLADIDIVNSAPRIRMEDTAGVSWFLNGNPNSGFFDIRYDSGSGEVSPFMLRSEAPADSFYLEADGRVGIGTIPTTQPDYKMVVEGNANATKGVYVDGDSRMVGEVFANKFKATGKSTFQNEITISGSQTQKFSLKTGANTWHFAVNDAGNLNIRMKGNPTSALTIKPSGEVVINGPLTVNGGCTGC